MDDADPLHLFDKDEFWDITRKVCPDITREEFARMWDEFQVYKDDWIKNRRRQ